MVRIKYIFTCIYVYVPIEEFATCIYEYSIVYINIFVPINTTGEGLYSVHVGVYNLYANGSHSIPDDRRGVKEPNISPPTSGLITFYV